MPSELYQAHSVTVPLRPLQDLPRYIGVSLRNVHSNDLDISDLGNARLLRSHGRFRNLTKLAGLGGYLARARDPPSGNAVIWRGLSRLRDIEIGAKIVKGYG